MKDWRHRLRRALRHSLQTRLVLLFIGFAAVVTVVFLLGMSRALHGGWEVYARPMVADYVDRLAAEIGTPPSKERAIALAARLPLAIRIEGPRINFDTHPQHRYRPAEGGDGEDGSWSLVRDTADGHRIRFGLAGTRPSDRPRLFGLVTLALLLTLTAAAWWWVHRMLRPIGDIGAGAARFGDGDFARPIPVRRDDELGDLARRINTMAGSLAGMLDAKRALLLAISHELRSPLTRARVNAELIPDTPERAALLRDLAGMRELIDDLMESERLALGHAALKPEPVDLAALVKETLAQHFPEAKVSLRMDEKLGPVNADAARIRLLLRNLVGNALRHAAGAAQPPLVTLRRSDHGELRLTVRDFGPGVDDAQLASLAQAFYRPDSARTRASGGVGLGLYLCRLVAQAHGGRLLLKRAQPGLEAAMVWGKAPLRSSSTP